MIETAPRLYLIAPPSVEAARFAPILTAALDAGDVACVFCPGEAADAEALRELARLTQNRGVAFLVADSNLATQFGTDGVHINGIGPVLDRALAALKPHGIVGVGALKSRDDAMRAGEAGADYVMFGGPWEDVAPEVIWERTAWWAEVFNTPCVAYAQDVSEVAAMAATGAEFIALSAALWSDPPGAAAAIEKAMRSLVREPAA